MLRYLSLATLTLLLGGCATGYQSSGLTGGHSQLPSYGKLQKVQFAGNGFTRASVVQEFAVYRAAELAKEKNKPFFITYDSLGSAAADKPSYQPRLGLVDGKPIAYSFVLFLDKYQYGAKETQVVLKELDSLVNPPASTPVTKER